MNAKIWILFDFDILFDAIIWISHFFSILSKSFECLTFEKVSTITFSQISIQVLNFGNRPFQKFRTLFSSDLKWSSFAHTSKPALSIRINFLQVLQWDIDCLFLYKQTKRFVLKVDSNGVWSLLLLGMDYHTYFIIASIFVAVFDYNIFVGFSVFSPFRHINFLQLSSAPFVNFGNVHILFVRICIKDFLISANRLFFRPSPFDYILGRFFFLRLHHNHFCSWLLWGFWIFWSI